MGDIPQEKIKTFHQGQLIFREGQLNPVAYMVKKGSVTVYRVSNNRRVVVGRVRPGQIFGESAVITGEPFHANAEADNYVELLVLDQTTLKTLLLKCPSPMQRMVRYLMDRITFLEKAVHEQPSNNLFMSICQVLELLHRATRPAGASGQNGHLPPAKGKQQVVYVSYHDFCRTTRNMLLVSQLEIDEVLERLKRLGVVEVQDVKGAVYKTDILGQVNKSSEYVEDKNIVLKDPGSFLQVTRNLSREIQEKEPPETRDLEFMDIAQFAELAQAKPEVLYKKIAQQEIPENLFFFPRHAVDEFIRVKGEDFFQKAKRKRLNIDELETVDDLVFVDNNTLREVFQKLGFHKVLTLYAGAQDEARQKFMANMSKKIAAMVQDEASNRKVDDAELADIEGEAIDLVKSIKGVAKGDGK